MRLANDVVICLLQALIVGVATLIGLCIGYKEGSKEHKKRNKERWKI